MQLTAVFILFIAGVASALPVQHDRPSRSLTWPWSFRARPWAQRLPFRQATPYWQLPALSAFTPRPETWALRTAPAAPTAQPQNFQPWMQRASFDGGVRNLVESVNSYAQPAVQIKRPATSRSPASPPTTSTPASYLSVGPVTSSHHYVLQPGPDPAREVVDVPNPMFEPTVVSYARPMLWIYRTMTEPQPWGTRMTVTPPAVTDSNLRHRDALGGLTDGQTFATSPYGGIIITRPQDGIELSTLSPYISTVLHFSTPADVTETDMSTFYDRFTTDNVFTYTDKNPTVSTTDAELSTLGVNGAGGSYRGGFGYFTAGAAVEGYSTLAGAGETTWTSASDTPTSTGPFYYSSESTSSEPPTSTFFFREAANIVESTTSGSEDGDQQPSPPVTTEKDVTTTEHGVTTTEHGVITTEHGVTTTEHGVTTTEHGVTTTEHGVTTTEHGVTTTEEGVTTTEQAGTTTGQAVTSWKKALTTTEQIVTSTEQGVFPTEQAVTTTEQAVTTTELAATTTEVLDVVEIGLGEEETPSTSTVTSSERAAGTPQPFSLATAEAETEFLVADTTPGSVGVTEYSYSESPVTGPTTGATPPGEAAGTSEQYTTSTEDYSASSQWSALTTEAAWPNEDSSTVFSAAEQTETPSWTITDVGETLSTSDSYSTATTSFISDSPTGPANGDYLSGAREDGEASPTPPVERSTAPGYGYDLTTDSFTGTSLALSPAADTPARPELWATPTPEPTPGDVVDYNYYDGMAFDDSTFPDTSIRLPDDENDYGGDTDYLADLASRQRLPLKPPASSDTKGFEIASLVKEPPAKSPVETTHRRSDVLIEDDDEDEEDEDPLGDLQDHDSNDVNAGMNMASSSSPTLDTFEGQMLRRLIPLVVRELRSGGVERHDIDRLKYIFGPLWPEVERLALTRAPQRRASGMPKRYRYRVVRSAPILARAPENPDAPEDYDYEDGDDGQEYFSDHGDDYEIGEPAPPPADTAAGSGDDYVEEYE